MTRTATEWQRVSRGRPCPVCDRPDWCLYAGPADSPTAAICARVESPKRCGEADWLHKLRDDPLRPAPRRLRTIRPATPEATAVDFGKLAAGWATVLHPYALQSLAKRLGLSPTSLRRLGIGWASTFRAISFPMRDAAGQVVGIRLRGDNGRKWAVPGSREGLFIPSGLTGGGRLLVTEGPTDCAALLDRGFSVVGRPSCTGGVRHAVELAKRLAPAELVVVADNDPPDARGRRAGLAGAEHLAAVLLAYVAAVRVVAPPRGVKDARAWLQAGGTAADVQAAIDAATPRRLAVTCKQKGRCRDARAKQER